MAGQFIKFRNENTRETSRIILYSISIIAGMIALFMLILGLA